MPRSPSPYGPSGGTFKWAADRRGGYLCRPESRRTAGRHTKRTHRIYQYANEMRAIFVAHGSEISEKMDAGLSHVLKRLFTDEQFLRFLAGK